MKKCLAIDIALLPPNDVMDLAIKLNKNHGPQFILNKVDRLPHITLSQAIINKNDLPEVISRLKFIASDFEPIKLRARLIPNFIEPYENEKLVKLHRAVMESLASLVSYDVREEYFFDDHVTESGLSYVRDYRKKHALSNYYPHLTLGTTKPVKKTPDIDSIVKRLTICHLGNYNTCCKILAEATLHSSI